MPFELFEPSPVAANESATVRLGIGSHIFRFSGGALSLLKAASHVRILFDEDTRRMAFQPSSADDPVALLVTYESNAATIEARSFARHHRVAPGRVFSLAEDNGILVADVGEPFGRPANE